MKVYKNAISRIALVAIATALTVATVGPVVPAAAAPSNTVLNWNATTVAALMNLPTADPTPGAGQPPTVGVIHMAMVQGAVYDAVNSIVGGYEPYLDVAAAPPGASIDAAVATAAHHVLIQVIPLVAPLTDASIRDAILARVQTQYETELAAISPGAAKSHGETAGAAAAAAMLANRMGDGQYPTTPFMFTQGTGIGEWRPTNGASDPFAWVAHVRPFTLRSTSQFRTAGPNAVTSAQYAKEYAEVKALGAATGSTRTPEQTALATFYIPNPVEIFNRTFRTISTSMSLGVADQARLYAMLNLAGADALINCWDDKEFWHFWRPVTAIQSGCRRRELRDRRGHGLGALHLDAPRTDRGILPADSAVSRSAVRLQLPDELDDAHGEAVLRGQGDVHRRAHARGNRAHVHPVHGCREGHDRCPRLPRYPLPDGGRRWCEPRQERRELGGISLLQTRVDLAVR